MVLDANRISIESDFAHEREARHGLISRNTIPEIILPTLTLTLNTRTDMSDVKAFIPRDFLAIWTPGISLSTR
jgi:hypothetical protein